MLIENYNFFSNSVYAPCAPNSTEIISYWLQLHTGLWLNQYLIGPDTVIFERCAVEVPRLNLSPKDSNGIRTAEPLPLPDMN